MKQYPRWDELSDVDGELRAAYEQMRKDLAELREDAERYRWLRNDDCEFSVYTQPGADDHGWLPTSSGDLDAAIDAKRAARSPT